MPTMTLINTIDRCDIDERAVWTVHRSPFRACERTASGSRKRENALTKIATQSRTVTRGKIETLSAAEVGHHIGGAIRSGASGCRSDVHNLATGARRTVALADEGMVDAAVQAANAAFPPWADTADPPGAGHLQVPRVDEPAQGSAGRRDHRRARRFTDAEGEVSRAIDVVEFACGIPQLLKATTPIRCPPASTTGRCGSHSAWWPASRRSTSRAWCRHGCSRSLSPVVTALS